MPEPIVIEAQDGGLIPTSPEPAPFVGGIPADPVPPEIPAIDFIPVEKPPVTYVERPVCQRIVLHRDPRRVEFQFELIREGSDDSVTTLKAWSITPKYNDYNRIYLRDMETLAFTGDVAFYGQVAAMVFAAAIDVQQRAAGNPGMDDKPLLPETP